MPRRFFRLFPVVLVLFMISGCGYNKMQQLEESVFKAWGDVESNLQRRADLIPNLVETVKGYASHEKETLQAVIEARAKATSVQVAPKDLGNAQAMQELLQAQGGLSSALARLMVVVERYPDLKANQNFLDLQNQLEGTENRINVARQRYNQAVETFNGTIRSFPNSLTNSLLLHLDRKEYFKAENGAKEVPTVKF
jgi:LemA protein